MESTSNEVAIIGASIAGAALALSLNQRSIPCRIFEVRGSPADHFSSGVTITPNGCRVLDALGILDRIAPKCFKQEKITYKNSRDETVEIVELASRERYGYQFHRLYRKELLAELKIMLEEQGIQIEYGTKFERVVSESAETGVVFELGGGRVEHAAFLVGADGIWSSVRKHISPCIPEYTGTVSVSAHIPTASVPWPDGSFSNRYCTIQGKPGALFVIPEVADGSEILVGRQFAHEDLGRDGWETLDADHQRLISLFRRNYEDWHPTAQGVIDQVCIRASEVLLWPYTKVPKLERWASQYGRVAIVGDAAHALPPSSGQGVSQALEDVYTLALLVRGLLPSTEATAQESTELWGAALDFWHDWRQKRVDSIVDAARAVDERRLPEAERTKYGKAIEQKMRDPQTMEEWRRWIYQPDMEGDMAAWIEQHR